MTLGSGIAADEEWLLPLILLLGRKRPVDLSSRTVKSSIERPCFKKQTAATKQKEWVLEFKMASFFF